MPGYTLAVHNFTRLDSDAGASASPKGKQSALTPSEDGLLAQGREIVAASLATKGWRPVVLPSASSDSTRLVHSTPQSSAPHAVTRGTKKRRGQPGPVRQILADVEDIDVSKLEEFQSTDVSYLFKNLGDAHIVLHAEKRAAEDHVGESYEEVHTANIQRKNKRRKLDTPSLHMLISQPHHHSYPLIIPTSSSDITKLFRPYSKNSFTALSPYTAHSAQTYRARPFARSAWIVPVSGSLPWAGAGASSAVLASEPTLDLIVKNSKERTGKEGKEEPNTIYWTPLVLREFWSFVLEVRTKAVLGAISLSYHVPSLDPRFASHQLHQIPTRAAGEDNIVGSPFQPSVDPGATLTDETAPGSLLQCAHIKIYHDARFAMYVRSVLDAWKVDVGEEVGASAPTSLGQPADLNNTTTPKAAGGKKIKARPLQGKKLVLVDEAVQAIGIC